MKLFHIEKGTGTTALVFLHYFGGASTTWDCVTALLEHDTRCITVDLPGFGQSPSGEDAISVAESSRAVLSAIECLALTRYVLVGHSMGGKVALQLASLQPPGLQALLLFAPSPPSPEPMTDDERTSMINAFNNRDAVEKMIRSVTGSSFAASAFEKEVTANLLVSQNGWLSWPQLGSRENITEMMKHVSVPISLYCGSADKKFTKTFLQEEFSQYFPSFFLKEIDGCGHLLPAENPEAVALEIRQAIGLLL